MLVDTDTRWFDEVVSRLRNLQQENKRIPLETLRAIFAEVFAHRPSIPQRRDWLLQSLEYAVNLGVIRFPKDPKSWDGSGTPSLPKYVTRIEIIQPKDTWWKTYYWHHKLDWVANLSNLPRDQGEFLKKVQQGLVMGWYTTKSPLKYRSLQLTGDEKHLEELLKSQLFFEERLTLEFLNTDKDIMPLAYEIVGRQPKALVFENKGSYNVARLAIKKLAESDRPYGILAYGGGGTFLDSVRDFANIKLYLPQGLDSIEYVGDLDWAGLAIAQRASKKARICGLPPVVPAKGLHLLMLEALLDPTIQSPNGFRVKRKHKANEHLLEWLSENVRTEVGRVLRSGNRVPEEMLTEKALLQCWNIS
jgi:hypothetical protein